MFGDDFSHPEAQKSYSRMDQIIKILKHDHPNLEVSYSTFADYFKDVMKSNNEWPKYEGDFSLSLLTCRNIGPDFTLLTAHLRRESGITPHTSKPVPFFSAFNNLG